MDGKNSSYNRFHKAGSLLMTLALLWLTISIPFVYEAQQQYKVEIEKIKSGNHHQEDNPTPFSNSNEEKTPVSISEEYLHCEAGHEYSWIHSVNHYFNYSTPVYLAFHGEQTSPPPKA